MYKIELEFRYFTIQVSFVLIIIMLIGRVLQLHILLHHVNVKFVFLVDIVLLLYIDRNKD